MAMRMIAMLGGMLAFSGLALAAEPAAVAPMGAFVQDIGGKQIVGYYTAADAACQVTMMVTEAPAATAEMPGAARVRFALAPLSSATVESAEGGKLAVTCGAEAASLVVDSHPAAKQLASR